MAEYRVSFEINIAADTPLQAAQMCEAWIKAPGDHWQFHVQEEGSSTIFSVDLEEPVADAVTQVTNYSPIIKGTGKPEDSGWAEDEDGNELCECGQPLRTVVDEGVGKQLHEVKVCSDPECETHLE